MTLSTTASRVPNYPGTGSTGPFAFPFRVLAAADLLVTKRNINGVESTLIFGPDFTVTGVGNASGSVTLTTALNTGETLTIRRAPALTQAVSIRNLGSYFAATHEDEFDRLVMQLQSLQDQINRSLRLSESYDPASYVTALAPAAGYILGWNSGGTGIESRPAQAFSFLATGLEYVNVKDPLYGAIGNGIADDTVAINAALALGKPVAFPAGTYKITNDLLPASNTSVFLAGPSVTIKQTAANKHVFKVVQKDNVWIHCNGGTLYGEGSWSAAWSDFATHNDRGVGFYGCTNSGITKPRIQNMAMSGIAILGGSNITIDSPNIEGTHALGHPLTLGVSIYQFCIVVMHDVTYGAFDNVHILAPKIFNVAMGINSVENLALSTGLLSIVAPMIYDIRGQHGMYMGTSYTTIVAPIIDNCGLDGIKIYSGANNEQLKDIIISNFNITNCVSGQAVEFGVSGTGFIYNAEVTGRAFNVARIITFDGDIRRSYCKASGL
jgi:hypothetical protein